MGVDAVTAACFNQLSEISRKLKANREGLGIDTIIQYKEEIATLGKELVKSEFMSKQAAEACASEIGKRGEGNMLSSEELKRNIRQKISEGEAGFDPSKQQKYINVVSILMDCGKKDEIDEDMVLIDSGLTEQSVKCPYTGKLFHEPMKKSVTLSCFHSHMSSCHLLICFLRFISLGGGSNQPACIHHISRDGLMDMCRNANIVKCPIGGCRGKWSMKSSVRDEDFERQVAKYLRAKKVAEMAAEGTGAEESKDGGYTEL